MTTDTPAIGRMEAWVMRAIEQQDFNLTVPREQDALVRELAEALTDLEHTSSLLLTAGEARLFPEQEAALAQSLIRVRAVLARVKAEQR